MTNYINHDSFLKGSWPAKICTGIYSVCGLYFWCWSKLQTELLTTVDELGGLWNPFTDSAELYFARCHEWPKDVKSWSVTTQLDHGSIVKWKCAPVKAIIKMSYSSTATGASFAFSDQRFCWAHIICKTERERLWEKHY